MGKSKNRTAQIDLAFERWKKVSGKSFISRLLYSKEEVSEKRAQLETLVHLHLIENNPEYMAIVQKQWEVIKGARFKLTSHKMSPGKFIGQTTAFKGLLRKNGHAYLDAARGDISVLGMYAEAFEGKIDALGRITLNASQTAADLIKSRPVLYEGQVGEKGTIRMKVAKTQWYPVQGFVLSVIGQILSKSASNAFFKNVVLLRTKVDEHIKGLALP